MDDKLYWHGAFWSTLLFGVLFPPLWIVSFLLIAGKAASWILKQGPTEGHF